VVSLVVRRGAAMNGCSRQRTCQAAISTFRATADVARLLLRAGRCVDVALPWVGETHAVEQLVASQGVAS
jgi:hypothetical protein